jgi:hypothetical protein
MHQAWRKRAGLRPACSTALATWTLLVHGALEAGVRWTF